MASQDLATLSAQARTYVFGGLTVLPQFTGRSLNELRWTKFQVEPHVVDTTRLPTSLRNSLVAQCISVVQADSLISPTLITPTSVDLTAGGVDPPDIRFRASLLPLVPPWTDSMGTGNTITTLDTYDWPVKTTLTWALAPGVLVVRSTARFDRTDAVKLVSSLTPGSQTVVFVFTPRAMDGNDGSLIVSDTNSCSHQTTSVVTQRITSSGVARTINTTANPREFSPVLIAVTFGVTGTTVATIDRYGLTVSPTTTDSFLPFDSNDGEVGVDSAFDLFELLVYATPITPDHMPVLMQLAAAYGVN